MNPDRQGGAARSPSLTFAVLILSRDHYPHEKILFCGLFLTASTTRVA